MLLLFFARNYYFMVFLFALWGIAATFSSGSKDSWIVDLVNKKDKKIVHSFFKKQQMIINFGLIISGILGAIFVRSFGTGIVWLVTAVSYLASIVLLFLFAKGDEVKILEKRYSVFKQSKEAISYGYKHHVLFYYLSATLIFAFAGFIISSSLSFTPLLKSLNFPDYALGYVASLVAFIAMISPIFSKRYTKARKERNFIIFCLAVSAVIALFVLFALNWLSIILVISGVELFINIRGPASEVYFHRFVPSELRATMSSLKSLLISIAAALFYIVGGYLIDLIGPRYTFIAYSLLIIPVVILYLKIDDDKKEITRKG
jgi:predicted MFS family arabinose efflux permease